MAMALPENLKDIHLMGVAGTGMGSFAGLLKAAGYTVRGSDDQIYPPMSTKLEEWGIEVKTPYGAGNLDPAPDLVVVGNVIRKTNPEAEAMRKRGLAHASFPATLSELFLKERHSVVVAGTHGKTTTSCLLAHVLHSAGRDPGFVVGGIPKNFGESFRLGGKDAPFVLEGDEYDTAYFDKGPKFLHYRPRSLLCTSLEFDHADIYDNVEQIVERFIQLLELVPAGGRIVLHEHARLLKTARSKANIVAHVQTYGDSGDWVARDVEEDERGVSFLVQNAGEKRAGRLHLSLSGDHNVHNALGAYAICDGLGIPHDEIARAFASFDGVKRRMEVIGEEKDVLVVDDFAHHPTAVKTTVHGARRRYRGRPLWALFEPRSATSCRRIFQDDYAEAFDEADQVLLAPPGRQLDPDEALDVPLLAKTITSRGIPAMAAPSIADLIEAVRQNAEEGTVLLCMSNGAFGGIHQKLLQAIKERA
jgi:UDP-N-acetylmuramate: L-alanyl-gamma-D-glutamyl-meso-diaminopimelate ligase